MPSSIPLPQDSYSDIGVSLSGDRYTFTFRYNERADRWHVDIKNSDDIFIVTGLRLVEGLSPTIFLELQGLTEGFIYIVEMEETEEQAGRDNLGIDKTYELVYTQYEELEQ